MFFGLDVWDFAIVVWLTVDLIATVFDIWIRMRHEKWETEIVPKKDIELLRHFLEHDYEIVAENKKSWIVRKFR